MTTGKYLGFFEAINTHLRQFPRMGVSLQWQTTPGFACLRCGQGCRTPWRIEVPQSYYEDWGPRLADFFQAPLESLLEKLPPAEATPHRYAALKKNPEDPRACVFLNADQLCRIHLALGPQAKPPVCLQYPFNRSGMPWPFYQSEGLALSCRGVGQDLAQPAELVLQWQALPPEAPPQIAFRFSQHSLLSRFGFHWLLGALLDLLETPIEGWLTQMATLLRSAFLLQAPVLDVAHLQSLAAPKPLIPADQPFDRAQLQDFLTTGAIGAKAELQNFKAWLGQPALPEPLADNLARPLALALKGWLQRQIIGAHHLLTGDLWGVQQGLVWAVEVLMISYYRSFLAQTRPDMPALAQQVAAINQIYAHLVQDHFPPAIRVYQRLSPEVCLDLLGGLAPLWAAQWQALSSRAE